MGMFDMSTSSVPAKWPSQKDPSTKISGTVVCIDAPFEREFNSTEVKTFKDGSPRRQIRLTILTDSGEERCWYFTKAFREKKDRKAYPTHPWNACMNAMDPSMEDPSVSLVNLLGRRITVETKAGQFGIGNPKPFRVTIDGMGAADKVRGAFEEDVYHPETIVASSVGDAFNQLQAKTQVYDDVPF